MIAFVLEDDLGQRHRGEVFAAGGVDDRDFFAVTNHLLDFLEGDVTTLLRVVEFPIGVPLDDVRHGSLRATHYEADNTARQAPARRRCYTCASHSAGGLHETQR